MSVPLLEFHGDRIAGVLSCDDRIAMTARRPTVCCAAG